MILELHHKNDGTLEILVPWTGYAQPRTFGWYSDAVSVIIGNYRAEYKYHYSADFTTGYTKIEIWENNDSQGEILPFS